MSARVRVSLAGPALLAGLVGLAGLLGLAGCGYQGVTSLPLPGAVGGAGTYQVAALFEDATNLVAKETCRANDVAVGSVSSITVTPDLRARVNCSIKDSVALPANAVATLAETSLLGERYVSLDPPAGTPPVGRMAPGTVIPVDHTRATPDTEQVLGALSAVLNGGNLQAVQTINTELNQGLTGHETDIRSLLDQLTTFTGQLDANSAQITRSLDGLDHLSGTVAAQRQTLGRALDTIPGGLRVLNDQRGAILDLLAGLTDLSHTATPVINASTDNTVATLHALDPILTKLDERGDRIASALEMLSYPIPANGPSAIQNDYGGLHLSLNLDTNTVETLLKQELAAPLSNRAGPLGSAAPPKTGSVGPLTESPLKKSPLKKLSVPPTSAAPELPPTLGGLLTGGDR